MPVAERPQHEVALERANQYRFAQARLKREIKAGEVTPADVLDHIPKFAGSLRIGALLTAQDHWGHIRAEKLLAPLAIHPHKRLRDLTARQRGQLVGALNGVERDERWLAGRRNGAAA